MTGSPRLPDFLIVGAMKSGTCSLRDSLRMHPDIHMYPREVHFFNRDENYARGLEWYSQCVTAGLAGQPAAKTLIGEKTPAYCCIPGCAERIRSAMPDARLIWILRNPVRRAYSHYLHRRRTGYELLSLRAALAREPARVRASGPAVGYVERGKYVVQIEAYLRWFPLSQMHFLLFERFIADPATELGRITDFLGLPAFETSPPRMHSHPSRVPGLVPGVWLAHKLFGKGHRMHRLAMKLSDAVPGRRPAFPDDIRQDLAERFAPFNNRLAELTGLDLSPWRGL
jgi:hypothetical protein